MQIRHLAFLFVLLLTAASCGSCGDKNNDTPDTGMTDDMNTGDVNAPDMSDDATVRPDADTPEDMGTDMSGPTSDEVVVECDNAWTPPATGLCDTAPGAGEAVLFQVGTVLTPNAVYANGTVAISGKGPDARITCVGCDCAAQVQNATTITCAEGALSPSLINAHDHITFSLSWPQTHGDERFDHRHDWRRGLRGHTDLSANPSGDESREGILYGELRLLLGGATSVAGSVGDNDAAGFLRNLDGNDLEGLTGVDVDDRTFPLGDFDATLLSSGCDYPRIDAPTRAANAGVYLPHIAEGIDAEANNEFRCLSSSEGGGVDLLASNTTIIHGIGLTTADIALVAAEGAKLVWSPRSNIDLYGNTARVTTYKNFGVTIALGTDWSASGSMNVLRELKCADHLNSNYFNNAFTSRELWLMSTYNAAVAMGADSQIGVIAEGFIADLALFDGRAGENYRSVIDAETADVHLVLRGGSPLYGDANIIEALVPAGEVAGCEPMDICGNARRICAQRDAGLTVTQIRTAVSQNAYPLFFCGTPDREPSCDPIRPDEYTGITANDADGDGLDDGADLCPAVFSPIRPIDGMQLDADDDVLGDDCDACPLSAEGMCAQFDPDDRDADGVPNVMDNCPGDANPDQANGDGDPFGDACDPCPNYDNTTSLACPATIYEIRAGTFGPGDSVAIEDVIVTAVSDRAFFVQVASSASYYAGVDFSGLYIFAGRNAMLPAVGDIISVEGKLDEFGDTLELTGLANLTVKSSGNTLPSFTEVAPAAIDTGGPRAAALEGTLVRVRDVTVTNANPDDPDDFGEFEADGLRVDDLFYVVAPDPTLGMTFAVIQGPLTFSFGNSKLIPRGASDVVSGPPALTGLEPSTSFLRAGTTGATAPPLTVVLTGPSVGVTTVNLTYTGSVSGPATVAIPDGVDRATLQLTGGTAGAGTVRATLDMVMSTANVTVYDDASTRAVASLSPATASVGVNGQLSLTVALSLPAPAAGQSVSLSYAGGLTGPASVLVPADQLTATFTVTAPAAAGAASVTATVGPSMQTSNVDVTAGSSDCLIISEYIEGTGSNNKAFELYNCSPAPLDLADFGVCLVTNANTSCSSTAALPMQSLPVGGVFTICRTMSGTAGDPVADIANNCNLALGGVANFNGNDRLVVFRDANGNDQFDAGDDVTDAFGQIAVDPGSIWANTTYRRCDFTPHDGVAAFDVATRYTAHGENDATDYGTAPVEGCP